MDIRGLILSIESVKVSCKCIMYRFLIFIAYFFVDNLAENFSCFLKDNCFLNPFFVKQCFMSRKT